MFCYMIDTLNDMQWLLTGFALLVLMLFWLIVYTLHQTELLRLNLAESYLLPILHYSVGVIKYTDVQHEKLIVCSNIVFSKFMVSTYGTQSKCSYVALAVLILSIYELSDVLNFGKGYTLVLTQCWELCSLVM